MSSYWFPSQERHAHNWTIRFSFALPANAQMGRWRERKGRSNDR
jgi:hypothetical protein